jgi:CHAT domain-containing protein
MATGLDLAGILEQIPEGGALVAPLVTSQGSAVFLLPAGAWRVEAQHVVFLDEFTADDLNAMLMGSQDNPGWLRMYSASLADGAFQDWLRTMQSITGRLWEVLMGPVHQRLGELGLSRGAPVILMPHSGLGLLPLHAAWGTVSGVKRTFLDDYTVSYAPSAYALSVSRQRLQDERRHRPTLLGIIDPNGGLPLASIEGQTVAAAFPSVGQKMLIEREATREAIQREARGHAYLHYSGHGYYDWRDAMGSGLILANNKLLTLAEIISKLDLSDARLVVLAASETGLTWFEQALDEYVGLAAGFLEAGAPGVVSALWSVNDLSTMLLMEKLYIYHLRDGMEIAAALRRAQLWLRDVTAAEVLDRLSAIRKAIALQPTGAPSSVISAQLRHFATLDPDARPFDHPFYWAAFHLIGV